MTINQVKRPSGFEPADIEAATHAAITPWVAEHARSSGGLVSDLGYDRDAHPYQRLDVAYTPVQPLPRLAPDFVIKMAVQHELSKTMGSSSKARQMVRTFRETPAAPGSDFSVSEDLAARVGAGETVGVLVDHLKQGDYKDMALVLAGLILATKNIKLRDRTDVLFGKNISRQAYEGKPIAEKASAAVGIVWTVQNTANRRAHDFPERGVRTMLSGMKRAIEERRSQGGLIIGVVPSGTAMRVNPDNTYERPDAEPSIALISKWDALLPVAYYDGEVIAGPIEVRGRPITTSDQEVRHEVKRLGRIMAYNALDTLAQNDADLTCKAVRYKDAEGHDKVAWPNLAKLLEATR